MFKHVCSLLLCFFFNQNITHRIFASVRIEMLVTQVVIILAFIGLYWWRTKPSRDFAAKIPGYNGVPVFGSIFKYLGVPSDGKFR